MSNQPKVTDFFVTQKKTDNTFRSAKKITSNVSHSVINKSDVDQSVAAVKTPKRKKVVTKDKTLNSSKKKKTTKNEVIIEFKTNKIEVKEEESGSKPKVIEEKDKILNAKQIKEKLKKCNNLLELKKELSKINGCGEKVKQFKEIKVKTPTKSVFRTPTKQNSYRSPSKQSPRRPIMSNTPMTPILPPHKSPHSLTPNKNSDCALTYRRRLFDVFEDEVQTISPKKAVNKNLNVNINQRAFQGFSSLVNTSEDNQTLVLPQKFKLLSDIFKAIDTIVSMHYKRQEVCTFDKLKTSVERMTSRKFDTKKLSQIQTVFPNAFKMKYEMFSSILSNQKPSHQLVITPIYNSNVDIRLSSTHLLERHQMFFNKLLDITKRHHKQYLNGLGLNVEDRDVFRWHKKFRLDSVPDIEPNDNALPSEPKFGGNSAETFLETTRQRLGLPSAFITTDSKDFNSNDNQDIDNKPKDSTKKVTKGPLKGISIGLLNKIRAKEAANLTLEMTRKPEVETELRILRTLPEFVRIIHSFFIGAKKFAVQYDELIDKIVNSFSASLSILRAREHVDYMTALLPDWIQLLEVKKGNYIKINKQTNLSALEDKINQKVNHLKKFT